MRDLVEKTEVCAAAIFRLQRMVKTVIRKTTEDDDVANALP